MRIRNTTCRTAPGWWSQWCPSPVCQHCWPGRPTGGSDPALSAGWRCSPAPGTHPPQSVGAPTGKVIHRTNKHLLLGSIRTGNWWYQKSWNIGNYFSFEQLKVMRSQRCSEETATDSLIDKSTEWICEASADFLVGRSREPRAGATFLRRLRLCLSGKQKRKALLLCQTWLKSNLSRKIGSKKDLY